MASIIGSDTASALEKERNVDTGEIKQKLVNEVDVRGRNILIVDDIVSTGKTIAQAANMLKKEKGAKKVAFAYVHPVHSPGAVELMRKTSPIFIATTDTIDNSAKGIEVVSVAGAVAKKIKEIL
jgi:ribose-phosphate pyrophosphokinase